MKLKDLFCRTRNKRTNQMSLHLKARVLRMEGLTPEQLWKDGKIDWPKPRIKILKLR